MSEPLTPLIPPFQLESHHSMDTYLFQLVKRSRWPQTWESCTWSRTTMSTQTFEPKATASANLVQIAPSVEDTIQQRLAEERARLEKEAGLVKRETHQFKRPVERPFTAAQRRD